MYSRETLAFMLKLGRAKSLWNLSEDKIQKKRNLMKHFGLLSMGRPKEGVNIEKKSFKGFAYYIISPTDNPGNTVVFYSHGGGYVYEITYCHWEFIMDLCKRTGVSFVVPIYPLAPEHTKEEVFPWIYELFCRVYSADIQKNWVLMGDSAGGGLSLAIYLKTKEEGTAKIKATVLISPWLDIRMNSKEMIEISKVDPLLDSYGLIKCGEHYLGDCPDDLMSSPLYGNVEGIDNLAVFTGTADILNPMARIFKEHCRNQGVKILYFEYEDSIHVFPIFRTKDGLDGREKIVNILISLQE